MRPRPIRSRIYIPVRKLGVVLEDWKYVAAIALFSYSAAFFLNITIYHIPVEYITGFGGLIGSITFFNWARIGRPPGWIYYRVRGMFTSYEQRGVLPGDRRYGRSPAWLLTPEAPAGGWEVTQAVASSPPAETSPAFVLRSAGGVRLKLKKRESSWTQV